MRPLRAKLVAKGRESDPKDTPLVPHEQEFVFLSTPRGTYLKSNAVRPEIVSMGQERGKHSTLARRRAAAAHSHTTVKKNDEIRPHHGDVIRPDVERNFRFGPLRRGKFIFRLIKNSLYCRVDSVSSSSEDLDPQFIIYFLNTFSSLPFSFARARSPDRTYSYSGNSWGFSSCLTTRLLS
jgi:hypothetical protein